MLLGPLRATALSRYDEVDGALMSPVYSNRLYRLHCHQELHRHRDLASVVESVAGSYCHHDLDQGSYRHHDHRALVVESVAGSLCHLDHDPALAV